MSNGHPVQERVQRRAAKAWEYALDVRDNHIGLPADRLKDFQRRYQALAVGAAAQIQANGLEATLAFWKAKAGPPDSADQQCKSHHCLLYQQLSRWVCQQIFNDRAPQADLLTYLASSSRDAQARATAESIAFALWLRRLIEAALEE